MTDIELYEPRITAEKQMLSWRDTGGEIPRREARPVYAEELNTLGMDKRWRYV